MEHATHNIPRLLDILERIPQKKIIVAGDLMLDRYIWGRVSRISPEAPVPVVEIGAESNSLGGAANVANNVQALGALAIPVGVIGDDAEGQVLLAQAETCGFLTGGILREAGRATTRKTRVIAHNQHVVRIDRENKSPISAQTQQKLLRFLESVCPGVDGLIIEDYNKGLLSAALIEKIIALAKTHRLCTAVDPKFDHFHSFRDVTVFKPNRKETEEAFGIRLRDDGTVRQAAERLKNELKCANVLITLGEQGMHFLDQAGQHRRIRAHAKKVHDVSGAGDTVIGTLTAALATGASMAEAAVLANYAAGIVVAEIGAVPVTAEKLRRELRRENRVTK